VGYQFLVYLQLTIWLLYFALLFWKCDNNCYFTDTFVLIGFDSDVIRNLSFINIVRCIGIINVYNFILQLDCSFFYIYKLTIHPLSPILP